MEIEKCFTDLLLVYFMFIIAKVVSSSNDLTLNEDANIVDLLFNTQINKEY